MRIEIMVGNEDPIIYPLDKAKLTIGSDSSCDIVVDAPGFSRRHISIMSEGEVIYAVDQGSTNGSYINEERLVPGRRVEFTSFFPLRLGENVLVTLLSDEEAETSLNDYQAKVRSESSAPRNDPRKPVEEMTRVISLKDLKAVKTEKLISRRQDFVKKKISTKKKPEKTQNNEEYRFKVMRILGIIMVGAAAYYTIFMREPDTVTEIKVVGEIKPSATTQVAPTVPKPSNLVDVKDLMSKENLMKLTKDIKCVTDVEKYMCSVFSVDGHGLGGAIQVGTTVNVLLDGTSYYDQAKLFLPPPQPSVEGGELTPEQRNVYEDELRIIIAALFFFKGVPADIDTNQLKDLKLTFGLIIPEGEGHRIVAAITILPDEIKKVKAVLEQKYFDIIKTAGTQAVGFTKEYYRVY